MQDEELNAHPRSAGGSARGRHTSTRRVHDILRASISSGLTFSHDGLTEDFLVRELDASRNSVREALRMLSDEGLVDRRRKSGTSVSGSVLRMPLNDMVSPKIEGDLKIRWIERRVVPTTRFIRDELQTEDTHVGMIEHLFLLGGQPVGVRSLYFNKDHEIVETPVAMNRRDAFKFAFSTPIGRVTSVIEAKICDDKTSRMLRMPVNSPILVRQQTLYDIDDNPREVDFTHFRADRLSIVEESLAPVD